MRRVLMLVSAVIVLLASARAYADTVFNLQGTLQDGVGQFNGTITYFTQFQGYRVAGMVTDGAYSFTVPAVYFGETFDEGAVTIVDVFSLNENYDLSLYVPNPLLANGMGGSLCALSTPCAGANGAIVSSFSDVGLTGTATRTTEQFQTLIATPVGTPEPGSLLLLGTGMVAVAAGVRRRWVLPASESAEKQV